MRMLVPPLAAELGAGGCAAGAGTVPGDADEDEDGGTLTAAPWPVGTVAAGRGPSGVEDEPDCADPSP